MEIFHIVNEGFTTWFDVVSVIADEIEIFNSDLVPIKINKIKSDDWPSKVKRPQAGKRHGMIKRTNSQIRKLRGTTIMTKPDTKIVKSYMPYNR